MGRFKTDQEKVKKRMVRRTQEKLTAKAKEDPKIKAKLEDQKPKATSSFIKKLLTPRKTG